MNVFVYLLFNGVQEQIQLGSPFALYNLRLWWVSGM